MQLRAIIFDFDGTVLDTEVACYQSWKEAFAQFSCDLPHELWQNVVGAAVGTFDPWAYLEDQLGEKVARDQLEPIRRARELELVAKEQVKPGVLPLIKEAKSAGLGIGLATSSGRDWAEGHLRRLNILSLFDAIATADDVERPKPDPALYALASRRLGVEPKEAIAIEDSPTGAWGAKNAGVPCLVVPNAVTESYDFSMADVMVPTLAGMCVTKLTALWREIHEGADTHWR